jgi:hypothetical protein
VLAIGEVYWSIAMFFIGELCCNVCDWWRMENQKPCCLYCIIDGVNIQNLGTGLSKVRDHFRPNLVSLYPMVQKIFNFVTPIRSHGSNTGCMEKSLDTITLLVSSKECYNDYLYPCCYAYAQLIRVKIIFFIVVRLNCVFTNALLS